MTQRLKKTPLQFLTLKISSCAAIDAETPSKGMEKVSSWFYGLAEIPCRGQMVVQLNILT